MSEILIGLPLQEFSNQKHIYDFFEGLEYIEKSHPSLVVINIDMSTVEESVVQRLKSLLDIKNTPCLIITDKNSLSIFDDIPYIQTLLRELVGECLNDSLITLRKYNSIDQKIDRVSKKERNIYFYILGSLLLIEPLMKVLFLQLKTDFPIETVMGVVLSIEEPLKALEFWALFPLAGFALIRASGWSLFVFAGVHIYSAYALLTYKQFSWPFVQESPHVSSILLVALNLTLLIYFLIPENRRPFVNKTKDMFRKYKRLNIDGEGTLIFGENKMDVLIKDISLGGISFSASKDIKEFINLTIQIEDMSLSIEIKRTLQDGQKYIHGCRFNKLSFAEKKKLKKYLRKLDRNIEYYEHKAA